MPLQFHETPDAHLLRVEMTGKLTRRDYDTAVPVMDRFLKAHRPARLLVEMRDFHGWTPGAAWDDLRFGLRHYSDVRRMAVVGDKRWERWCATLCRPFTAGEVRAFEPAQRDEAERWVAGGSAS
jgi:hypothetical protein